MPLQDQVISINFGQGLDQKTSEKLVIPGKLLQLENALFNKGKAVNKRNGYDSLPLDIYGGGTILNPKGLNTFQDQIVCAGSNSLDPTDNRLFSYSTANQHWLDQGRYLPIEVSDESISPGGSTNSLFANSARLGDSLLYTWATADNTFSVNNTFLAVKDLSTGLFLVNDLNIDFSTQPYMFPKAVLLGDPAGSQKLAVAHLSGTDSNALALTLVSVGVGSPAVTTSRVDLSATSTYLGLNPNVLVYNSNINTYNAVGQSLNALIPAIQYDIQGTLTGGVVAYCGSTASNLNATPNSLFVKTFDLTGAITHTASVAAPGYATAICVGVDPTTQNIYVVWADSTNILGFPSIYYIVYNSTLTSVIHAKTLLTTTTLLSGAYIQGIVMTPSVTPGSMVIYWSVIDASAPAPLAESGLPNIFNRTLEGATGATTPIVTVMGGMYIYSEVFEVNSRKYIAINNRSSTQPTMFILNVIEWDADYVQGEPLSTVAKALVGRAGDWRSASNAARPVILDSGTDVIVPASQVTSASLLPPLVATSTNLPWAIATLSPVSVKLDFNSNEAYQSMVANTNQLWNGGIVKMYDGQSNVELGFSVFPEILSVSTIGGSLAAGTYQFCAVYEWLDAAGNLHRSAPSPSVQVVLASPSDVFLDITTDNVTDKWPALGRSAIQIAVYRTTDTGIVFHRVSNQLGAYLNFYNTAFGRSQVQLGSGLNVPDSKLIYGEQLYTTGNVIENIAPPPSMNFVGHNNRVFLIDSENRNTLWYCKSITPGIGLSFSDLLTLQIDARGGKAVCLADMDDKLVIFEEKQPLVVTGDGANDTGQGVTFSLPQPIPSDAGCLTGKGIITTPLGVIFKSPKGIYLLDRSLTINYWGSQVEAYNDLNVVSTLIMPTKNQIRMLTSDGICIIYDYLFNQWSTFTNHQGYAATNWDGDYVYVRTDGAIYSENPTSFLDDINSIAVKIQSAWIKGSIIQGFQRLKEYLQLGDYSNGSNANHGMQVSMAYDYLANPDLPGFSEPIAYYFGDALTSGSIQYRAFPEQQKCEAATFLIEELPTGASGEDFSLTDMSLLVGLKKGAFKMPTTQTAVS